MHCIIQDIEVFLCAVTVKTMCALNQFRAHAHMTGLIVMESSIECLDNGIDFGT